MQQEPQKKPRNILPDCIIPAIASIFTFYYLSTITEVPWIAQASAIVVSGLLLLAITAFIIRSLLRVRAQRETLHLAGAFQDLFGQFPTSARRFGLLALAIGYVWFIDSLGFTVTTFIFVFAAIVLLSSLANWKPALIVSVSCSVIGYIVFVYFFETRFPMGPIEVWLKGVL